MTYTDKETARVRGYNVWAWEEAWHMLFDLEIPRVPLLPDFVPAALELFLFDAAGCIDSQVMDNKIHPLPKHASIVIEGWMAEHSLQEMQQALDRLKPDDPFMPQIPYIVRHLEPHSKWTRFNCTPIQVKVEIHLIAPTP